jgi:hypothetical protein
LLISVPSEQNTSIHRSLYEDYEKHYLPDTLTGSLNLSTFPNLTDLIVEYQRLTDLNLYRNRKLKDISVPNNLIQTITFPQIARRLERINVQNNNIRSRGLSIFDNYPRLRFLNLGTNNINQIQQGFYNRWRGSLSPLRNLNGLEELDINATDISHGLQFLPTANLFLFTCGNKGRANALVNNIKRMLRFDEAMAVEEADEEILLQKVGKIDEWQGQLQQLFLTALIQQQVGIHFRPHNQ